ncbi:MAG: 50S ribosomal protein L24 [Candidatus Levybacteria bacterium RIFCSPLOWO2_01_FULL_38_13]|nr:MAG: 50S ribosomal protein L24 [Candidatus Levybacteria bacterium RIFCSPHIGHO2_01_FULL_41_15]OGH34768.1 MAG: 50S ribosomal protein L24 [Candidatus Levybacteria bacterium RIFCSPLOWO2_01_FULL_38_13]
MKLKKGDEVRIVKGKDKGKTGKIEKIFPKDNMVLIPNVNLYKRHLKARSQKQPSEIVTLTKPLSVSNARLICPKCHLPTRIGFDLRGGQKERICKKCKQVI